MKRSSASFASGTTILLLDMVFLLFRISGDIAADSGISPPSPAAIPCQEKLSDHSTAHCQRTPVTRVSFPMPHTAPRCHFIKRITVPHGCTCFVRCNHIVRADMRNIDRKFCHHTFVAVRSLRHASDHELPASDKQRNASVARQLCISSLSLENRMKSMFFGIASDASDNREI